MAEKRECKKIPEDYKRRYRILKKLIVNAKIKAITMQTDAHRKYAALRRVSGAGNEAKRKRFVRFL